MSHQFEIAIRSLQNRIRELERENEKLRSENKKLKDLILRLKQELNSKICPNCGVPCI